MLMSADEAYKKMVEINTKEETDQLEKVEKQISMDLKNGFTYFNGKLLNTIEQKLIDKGYKVEFFPSQRDGDSTKVTWMK